MLMTKILYHSLPNRRNFAILCDMDGEAKYKEVFRTLRSEILSGAFDAHCRFPSEGQLMRKFGVSRNTVRTALEELKRSGMIETRNGAGTFLTPTARGTTGTLGLIMPSITTGEIFPRICAAFTLLARREGYTTIFGDISSPDPVIRSTQALRLAHDYADQHVAGVLFEPLELMPDADETTDEIVATLEKSHIPFVLIDRDIVPPPERSAYDLIGLDNVRVGYRLARHLLDVGARRIHFLMRPGSAPTVLKRASGVRDAVLDAGLAWTKGRVHAFDPSDVQAVRRELVRAGADAVVCGNDATAAALLKTLQRLKVDVPRDLRVTGVDDVRFASIVTPRLTTIRQPCEQLAEAALAALVQRIRNPKAPPHETLLDAELVIRASTR